MQDKKPDFRERMRQMTTQPGVYLMKDRIGNTIYVGKAKNLKKRLSSYFMPSRKAKADLKTRTLIGSIWDFETHVVRNEEEALILESKLIKQYRPRYNVSLRDDKRFWLVRVQLKTELPRFELTRLRRDDGAKYFGPFVHSTALKATLEWLNNAFGLRTCGQKSPGEHEYKHCHADVIRNCTAPCVGKISVEDYRARVMEAVDFLDGKGKRERFAHLREEMQEAAERMDFEKAAELRDVIQNLEKTLSPARQFSRGRGVPTTVKPTEDLADLGEYLGLDRPPVVMECFDISNVSSTHIVASMVRFHEGAPDNQNYRRYRMKTVESQDDFASMAEVVRRRYSRILMESQRANRAFFERNQEPLVEAMRKIGDEGKSPIRMPDLVIVDGGKGQLSAAYAELKALGLGELPIVGLAKQHEEIFFPGESESLRIDHSQGALKLMQRIRDEAHRYANNYNELLLRKRMSESLLDDVPGMSEVRKRALLQHFGSVAEIKKADARALQKVDGIGPKSAESIVAWFQRG
ncbi:GIY-YIG nuclease family protein [Rubritalea tangerina]|uniref:GIY-YIG nuclease family protein n=2 Tax=Rubritalea tangerina TaxID=430798 RepID=A0ABW4ZEJ0_9BACT